MAIDPRNNFAVISNQGLTISSEMRDVYLQEIRS